ncbi:MAG: glucose-1-phosphate cytidylyltransferase [Bdellovibrionales bacterium RIFOXYD12_FULL_39_22]|nr:MAG: glucose-1-phosphate cytidylyltransferase [Bdellovibrionales bacterium RIFOXYB1_FULL_39_21]OFZ41584.1 MAG: glucose-1-phosphate cytidylyltransferase [Bdellovibrionales bacterium RIFOXYC12_FULL_39_17]OFZ45897.1 MAG: glucose-1-phosphate cytidylyltransferase [Bdellovibrionales bacterium RIFOXYC1_FULL_39_130]OFZ74783.1 MAG: glucose-1-phosphate cytidylyltransferase [Bdellovibrionales bacterium RIFOXYD1_FULL_39_84]OFZ92689.1 MAG: glucose-1-phosphate cytidylyltransferase [Bdellovibrionales bacte
MKVVILAGGFGTRLSEETEVRPKPMVEIGGMPILWHIMKTYSRYGFNEFIICLGYKGYYIKEYFANYLLHHCDITIDLNDRSKMEIHHNKSEPWKISLIDTGANTQTGGRIKRIREYLNNETFFMTYGDGVADVNIAELLKFHKAQKKLATVTAVQPSGRFGALETSNKDSVVVSQFVEKPKGDNAWINAGFFVLEPSALDFVSGDHSSWEEESMPRLAQKKEMVVFKHSGFWKPMDTLREKRELEDLWKRGNAPWKVWGE